MAKKRKWSECSVHGLKEKTKRIFSSNHTSSQTLSKEKWKVFCCRDSFIGQLQTVEVNTDKGCLWNKQLEKTWWSRVYTCIEFAEVCSQLCKHLEVCSFVQVFLGFFCCCCWLVYHIFCWFWFFIYSVTMRVCYGHFLVLFKAFFVNFIMLMLNHFCI